MPVLHLSDIPTEVFDQLRHLAAVHGHTPEAEALVLLQRGVIAAQLSLSQGDLLAEMRRCSFTPAGVPVSVELIRQDCER